MHSSLQGDHGLPIMHSNCDDVDHETETMLVVGWVQGLEVECESRVRFMCSYWKFVVCICLKDRCAFKDPCVNRRFSASLSSHRDNSRIEEEGCKQGMSTGRALCRNKLVLDHTVNVRIGKQWGNPTKNSSDPGAHHTWTYRRLVQRLFIGNFKFDEKVLAGIMSTFGTGCHLCQMPPPSNHRAS